MRLAVLFAGFAVAASAAVGQTPGVIQVEVTEEVRTKADACRLDFRIEVRDTDPSAATDEVAAEMKRVTKAFAALKIEGATLTPLALVVARIETAPRNIRGGVNPPPEIDFRATRPFMVVVTSDDFDTLSARMTKVQTELFNLGVKNTTNGLTSYLNFYQRAGRNEAYQAALESAAKRGKAKAEGLAAAAGVQLSGVSSVEPVTYLSPADPTAPVTDQYEMKPTGEIHHRIRVKVAYHTK